MLVWHTTFPISRRKVCNSDWILQSDWMKETSCNTQPKTIVPDPTFLWWLSPYKKVNNQLTLSRDIDDKRTLQSNWTRGTPGHKELRVVSDATLQKKLLAKNLTPWKKTDINRFFPEILVLQSDWTRGTTTGHTRPKVVVADPINLHAKNLRYRLIPSRDNDDQKRLQTDWLTAFKHLTEKPDFSRRTFCRVTNNTIMYRFSRKKTHQWIKYFDKCQKKTYFKGIFGLFLDLKNSA